MKRYLFLIISIIFSVFIILFYPLAQTIKPFLPFTDYLLGLSKPISYLILLGNDTEMRANGGFAGSYAKIILKPSVIAPRSTSGGRNEVLKQSPTLSFLRSLNPDISFQDIYVPNGQLAGHVLSPSPIQQAFGKGSWELANADWEPDFPTAARDIRWFLEKGQEDNPDILAIMNLTTIKKVLTLIGSFPVPEYSASITPENLYLFLQGKAELNFFPGSTQKKDALTAVGQALFKKFLTLSTFQKIKIAKILYHDFKSDNLVINSSDEDFQNFLENQKLSGSLSPQAFDTYSLIETNLGANKANQFVSRNTTHQINHDSQKIQHQVRIDFTNNSPASNPNPPIHYGGDYVAYLRLYIPASALNIAISQSPETALNYPNPQIITDSATQSGKPAILISPKYGLTEIGFWHTTVAGGQSAVELSYDLILANPNDYSIAILKQNGLPESPQTISLFSQNLSTNLKSDFSSP